MTLRRVLAGVVVGVLVGVLVGLLMGTVGWARRVLEPWLTFLRALPPLAYFFLLVIWLGIDEAPKITVLALAAFPPAAVATTSAVAAAPISLIEAARAPGASRSHGRRRHLAQGRDPGPEADPRRPGRRGRGDRAGDRCHAGGRRQPAQAGRLPHRAAADVTRVARHRRRSRQRGAEPAERLAVPRRPEADPGSSRPGHVPEGALHEGSAECPRELTRPPRTHRRARPASTGRSPRSA
jgi:Binding-protein-dependent transport system inner membrane component